MKIKDILTLNIINQEHSGLGIGRVNNFPIFILNALPDETIKVEITAVKKKFALGISKEIIKPSKNRVTPICPYYDKCGGCDTMHQDYLSELNFKENKIKEIMSKFAQINENVINNIIRMPDDLFYRNKITFHISNGKLGFFSKKTHEIVSINHCYLCHEKINSIINIIQNKIDLKNISEITVRNSYHYDETMIIFKVVDDIDYQKIINSLKNHVTSIIVIKKNKTITIWGNDYIKEKIGDVNYFISPTSFFQVNTVGAKIIYDKILETIKEKPNTQVLDLYCGTGSIGLYISDYSKNVFGVEINKEAIVDANKNKKLNSKTNISFMSGDVSNIFNSIPSYYDIIILDPPRSGLDSNTIKELIKRTPKNIIYVSCDSITLARDLKCLKEYFDVISITPIDMFPKTAHVECVALLQTKN